MADTGHDTDRELHNDAFPLSNKYDAAWVLDNWMGPNPLWLAEWLCRELPLERGMRVLDMGCGKAVTSIFLAREFGVKVWATDLWIPATENWGRVREAGLEDEVFPVYAEAHALPYPEEFFDAVVSIDSYQYYGTDDLYLKEMVRFLRPGGRLGIVVPALMRDFDGPVPEHLTKPRPDGGAFWDYSECFCFHTAPWWRDHWARTRLVDVETADTLEDGWRHWLQSERAVVRAGKNIFPSEEQALEADGGRYIGFARVIGRRTEPSPPRVTA